MIRSISPGHWPRRAKRCWCRNGQAEDHAMSRLHIESHNIERIGWLRAAVLGANDGIVSTASLIVGVAAAAAGRQEVMLAGVAGLVAGWLSVGGGAYVSVSFESGSPSGGSSRERELGNEEWREQGDSDR